MSNDKKLTRSADNRWLGGVCGGLGEYFGIDPTLIRVIFVLASLLLGVVVGGMILYAILWILMPEAGVSIPGAKVISEDD
ncbi:MAG: PspC domain-containing protein [Anaerolineae bacterium]|nr:PspC domain-containing protein [Anaerolineae bacterium]